jgi:hypothetical protein
VLKIGEAIVTVSLFSIPPTTTTIIIKYIKVERKIAIRFSDDILKTANVRVS